ncbi:MAG: hypothetical protein GC168_10190 [Candidatus Hydrogenedens sp.]|nr:hypothetical protein [Candidatus Hydrogenedens sp.]
MKFRPRSCLGVVAALGIFLVSFVLFAEIGARVMYPRPDSSEHFETHPEMGYALHPGASVMLHFRDELKPPGRDYRFTVSSQGFRDREYGPKAEDEFRILLLGDSFTAGVGMDEEHMPSRLLEQEFKGAWPGRRIVVINAGTPGHGPWQERLNLLQRGLPLEPDVVVHQLYLTNDVHDEMRRVDQVLEAYERLADYFWRRHAFREHWNVALDGWLQDHSRAYAQYLWRTGPRLPLMRALSPLGMLGAYAPPSFTPPADREPYFEHALVEPNALLLQSFALIEESILATKADCEARSIRYLAYAQPDRGYVLGEELSDGPSGQKYDRDRDVTVLEDFFKQENIDFVPLGYTLRRHPRGRSAFFGYDGHMKEIGNQILAETIANTLYEKEVFPRIRRSIPKPAR